MYGDEDTGLGAAIAVAKPSLLSIIKARRALAPTTIQKPRILPQLFPKRPQLFPKRPLILRSPVAPVKPMVPVLPPSIAPVTPTMFYSTSGGGGGGGGGGGSEDTGDAPEVDTAQPSAAPKIPPIVLIGVGAVVLFMLSKKGR